MEKILYQKRNITKKGWFRKGPAPKSIECQKGATEIVLYQKIPDQKENQPQKHTFINTFSGFNVYNNTQIVRIRDGTEYEEIIGVKRFWLHPLRGSTCTGSPAYYDLTIMELGKSMDLWQFKNKSCWG